MAEFTHDRIYTYIRGKVLDAFPSMYITGDEEPIPAESEAVWIREMNHYTPKASVTLMHDEEVIHSAWEVQVYTNLFDDGQAEAYEIMRPVEKAFKELYFRETSCTPVERVNNRVARLVARFERIIGGGDQMP